MQAANLLQEKKSQTVQVFMETLVNQHAHFGLKRMDEDVMMFLLQSEEILVEMV